MLHKILKNESKYGKMLDAVESGSNQQHNEITHQMNLTHYTFDQVDKTRDPFMKLFVLFNFH